LLLALLHGCAVLALAADGGFTSDWPWLPDHDLLIYVASADPRHPADELREALLRALFRR